MSDMGTIGPRVYWQKLARLGCNFQVVKPIGELVYFQYSMKSHPELHDSHRRVSDKSGAIQSVAFAGINCVADKLSRPFRRCAPQ